MILTGWKAGWERWQKVSKAEFETHAVERHFLFGPEGDPWPERRDRQWYGILNDGRKVRAWLRGVDRDEDDGCPEI